MGKVVEVQFIVTEEQIEEFKLCRVFARGSEIDGDDYVKTYALEWDSTFTMLDLPDQKKWQAGLDQESEIRRVIGEKWDDLQYINDSIAEEITTPMTVPMHSV